MKKTQGPDTDHVRNVISKLLDEPASHDETVTPAEKYVKKHGQFFGNYFTSEFHALNFVRVVKKAGAPSVDVVTDNKGIELYVRISIPPGKHKAILEAILSDCGGEWGKPWEDMMWTDVSAWWADSSGKSIDQNWKSFYDKIPQNAAYLCFWID